MKFVPERIPLMNYRGIPGPVGPPGKPGNYLRYLEFKINDFYYDDTDTGIVSNMSGLWGVMPCIDFLHTADGSVWFTCKAPEYFDYTKQVKLKLIYNLGYDVPGNLYFQGNSYVVNTNTNVNEFLPTASKNFTISGNIDNTGNLDVVMISDLTISTDLLVNPLYFSFKIKRLSTNVLDTYDGPFQLVSAVMYQDEVDFLPSIVNNTATDLNGYGHLSATDGTYLYLFGGYVNGIYSNTLRRYSIAGGGELLASGPQGGYYGAAGYINGKFYVTLYHGASNNDGETWEYDPIGNAGANKGYGPIVRYMVGSMVHDDKLGIFGGHRNNKVTMIYDLMIHQQINELHITDAAKQDILLY